MKAEEFEWVSESMSPAALQSAIQSLPDLVRTLVGDCLVTSMYGWGCNLHMDLCYVPMRVGTKWIDKFIGESLEQRIIVPGQSDFYIELPEERVEILFCHEGDIHVSGPDEELRNKIFGSAPFNGLTFKKHRKEAQPIIREGQP
jgi:hypothetical protein